MEEITISDNGETEVQLTTLGTVYGSDRNGEPVEQHFTEEALQQIAEAQKDEEILVDSDHSSETGGSTAAAGWVSGLHVKPGRGLFGKIAWTDIGRKLIENRVFRWLSPSFWLDKDTKEPVQMTSVALTNKPSQAGEIQPIINSAPMAIDPMAIEGATTKEEDIMEEDREKKTEEVVTTEDVEKDEKTGIAEEKLEDKLEEAVSGKPLTREDIVAIVKEVLDAQKAAENACSDGETKDKEAKNEAAEPEPEAEDEVVKAEALNSSSEKQVALQAVKQPEWANLRGKAFFDWLKEHPETK